MSALQRRLLVIATLLGALTFPMMGIAETSAHKLKVACKQYGHDWGYVHIDTPDSPGRDVCRFGASPGKFPTLGDERKSDRILQEIIAVDSSPQLTQSADLSQAPSSSSSSSNSSGSDATSNASSASPGSSFAQCVANKESSNNPSYNDGTYMGLYNFDQEAWQEAGGTKYAPTPDQASADQQTQVFNSFYPSHPSAWPQTGPACGGG